MDGDGSDRRRRSLAFARLLVAKQAVRRRDETGLGVCECPTAQPARQQMSTDRKSQKDTEYCVCRCRRGGRTKGEGVLERGGCRQISREGAWVGATADSDWSRLPCFAILNFSSRPNELVC